MLKIRCTGVVLSAMILSLLTGCGGDAEPVEAKVAGENDSGAALVNTMDSREEPTRPRFAACVPFDKEDGSTPACIYDSAVDPDGEIHDDGIEVLPDSPEGLDEPPGDDTT